MRKDHLASILLLLSLLLSACDPFASQPPPATGLSTPPNPDPAAIAPGAGSPVPSPVPPTPVPNPVTPGTDCSKAGEVYRQMNELYIKYNEANAAGRREEAEQLYKAYSDAWQQLEYLRKVCPFVPERR